MDQEVIFRYRYSAKRSEEAEMIRKRYLEFEKNENFSGLTKHKQLSKGSKTNVRYNRGTKQNEKQKEIMTMNKSDQAFIAQRIRTQYMEEKTTELDKLRALDKEVKRPANILGYTLGSIGAVIMGSGMSLVMTDIGETLGISAPMVPGVILGVIGMAIAVATYPIHKHLLTRRKNRYAKDILALSEKIVSDQ